MTKPVRVSALAERHILEIGAWWRERREKAPDLFEQELAAGLQTIASAPGAVRGLPNAAAAHLRGRYNARFELCADVWGASPEQCLRRPESSTTMEDADRGLQPEPRGL